MNRDPGALNVFQNALVGGGLAARVVLRLQAVDGDDDVEVLEGVPLRGNFAEGAGDHLGVDTAAVDLRQQRVELAVTDQRIAADEGNVHGLVLVDEGEHARDQLSPRKSERSRSWMLRRDAPRRRRSTQGSARGTPW